MTKITVVTNAFSNILRIYYVMIKKFFVSFCLRKNRVEPHLNDLAVSDPSGAHDGQRVLSVTRRSNEECSLRLAHQHLLGGLATHAQVPGVSITVRKSIAATSGGNGRDAGNAAAGPRFRFAWHVDIRRWRLAAGTGRRDAALKSIKRLVSYLFKYLFY